MCFVLDGSYFASRLSSNVSICPRCRPYLSASFTCAPPVDLSYLEGVCQLCRVAGVDHFSLVSSQGASASSPLLYPKVKGQCEKVHAEHWLSVGDMFTRTNMCAWSLISHKQRRSSFYSCHLFAGSTGVFLFLSLKPIRDGCNSCLRLPSLRS